MDKLLQDLPGFVRLTFASYEQPELPPPSNEPGVELAIDDLPPKKIVIVLQFSEPGFGFGEVTLIQTPEGLFVNTEYMRLERVKGFFSKLLDSAITDWDEDPERHALYNRVMGSRCGAGCRLCHPEAAHEEP